MTDRELEAQRQRFERSGRLHDVHYFVVGISFLLTFAVWQYAKSQVDARVAETFLRGSDQILELVTERMQKYEDGLWAGVALINANQGNITRHDWATFAETLKIDRKYPGTNGIGVIFEVKPDDMPEFLTAHRTERPEFRVHPAHTRGVHLPITYIEPEATNAPALGLDIAFEDNRFVGFMAARNSGKARVTGPIRLVQDEGATPGFLFYAPFYSGGLLVEQNPDPTEFLGVVYAPFVVKSLLRGALDQNKRDIWLSISDGAEQIYSEHTPDDPAYDPDPLFTRHVEVPVYGRMWSFDFRTSRDFAAASSDAQPTIILVCGIVIDTLLLLLFVTLTRSNRRTVEYADRVSEELRREKGALQSSNTALEQFSYAASHDLKTPLRSMRDALDYLVEDVRERHAQVLADVGIWDQLVGLRGLVDRMERLVKGVLECSQISQKAGYAVRLETAEMIRAHAAQAGLAPEQLTLEGEFPDIVMHPGRFGQIMQNLLGNARLHHPLPDELHVVLTGDVSGRDLVLMVADNGIGIDPRYHEKIFEMFQSLHPERTPDATGIGLAIVKKAVETTGGTITVRSPLADGCGTAFVVRLPGVVDVGGLDVAAE